MRPLHTKHTKTKFIPRWVNKTVIVAKETKHLFECIWVRNKSTFNRSRYMQKVQQYNRIFMQAKFRAIITTHKYYGVLGDVLHRLLTKMLQSIKRPQLLAGISLEFFTEKIEKLCSTFSDSLTSQHITKTVLPLLHFFYCNRQSSYQNYYQFSK